MNKQNTLKGTAPRAAHLLEQLENELDAVNTQLQELDERIAGAIHAWRKGFRKLSKNDPGESADFGRQAAA